MAKAAKKVTTKKVAPVAKKPAAKKAVVKKTEPVIVEPVAEKKIEPATDAEVAEEKSGENVVSENAHDCPCPEPIGGTEFSEFTIKEIMVQKNVNREMAIEILRNPVK